MPSYDIVVVQKFLKSLEWFSSYGFSDRQTRQKGLIKQEPHLQGPQQVLEPFWRKV